MKILFFEYHYIIKVNFNLDNGDIYSVSSYVQSSKINNNDNIVLIIEDLKNIRKINSEKYEIMFFNFLHKKIKLRFRK